jgi:hypothetical protein
MTQVRISLAKINYGNLADSRTNPFWFTTDRSINLSEKTNSSVLVILENLSERSLLELSATKKLGLIEIEEETEFLNYLDSLNDDFISQPAKVQINQ